MQKSAVQTVFLVLTMTLLCFPALSHAAPLIIADSPIQANVKVIVDKLPLIKQEKMRDFQQKVERYINDFEWVGEEDIPPFEVSIQLFLEDQPSNIEDRYKCSILISAPDVQYFDKRAIFAFQSGEELHHDGQFTSLKGLIDFYMYLIIASEFDKMGYLEGAAYFDKARAVMEQGKFNRFFYGWDRREELIKKIYSKNYNKFREMKDYYFYALDVMSDDKAKAREYMSQAVEMLATVLENDRDLDAAKQFVDAHFQEVIDLFRKEKNKKPIETLLRIDPERKEIYKKYLH